MSPLPAINVTFARNKCHLCDPQILLVQKLHVSINKINKKILLKYSKKEKRKVKKRKEPPSPLHALFREEIN